MARERIVRTILRGAAGARALGGQLRAGVRGGLRGEHADRRVPVLRARRALCSRCAHALALRAVRGPAAGRRLERAGRPLRLHVGVPGRVRAGAGRVRAAAGRVRGAAAAAAGVEDVRPGADAGELQVRGLLRHREPGRAAAAAGPRRNVAVGRGLPLAVPARVGVHRAAGRERRPLGVRGGDASAPDPRGARRLLDSGGGRGTGRRAERGAAQPGDAVRSRVSDGPGRAPGAAREPRARVGRRRLRGRPAAPAQVHAPRTLRARVREEATVNKRLIMSRKTFNPHQQNKALVTRCPNNPRGRKALHEAHHLDTSAPSSPHDTCTLST